MRKRRKDFLPTFVLTIFFWLTWLFVLFFTAPESYFLLFTFYFLLFFGLFFTLSLLLGNSRRGFLLAIGAILFLILKWQKLANFLNIILLLAIVFSFELYFTKRK